MKFLRVSVKSLKKLKKEYEVKLEKLNKLKEYLKNYKLGFNFFI